MEWTINCDMTISFIYTYRCCFYVRSVFASLGFLREAFDQARPAAIDIPAHRSAGICAHGLELVVQKLDKRRFRPVGGKAHVDFRFHRRVRLPLSVDLPHHHQPVRRLPKRNRGNGGFGAVFRYLHPAAAKARPHQNLLNTLLAAPMLAPPPTTPTPRATTQHAPHPR